MDKKAIGSKRIRLFVISFLLMIISVLPLRFAASGDLSRFIIFNILLYVSAAFVFGIALSSVVYKNRKRNIISGIFIGSVIASPVVIFIWKVLFAHGSGCKGWLGCDICRNMTDFTAAVTAICFITMCIFGMINIFISSYEENKAKREAMEKNK